LALLHDFLHLIDGGSLVHVTTLLSLDVVPLFDLRAHPVQGTNADATLNASHRLHRALPGARRDKLGCWHLNRVLASTVHLLACEQIIKHMIRGIDTLDLNIWAHNERACLCSDRVLR